MSTPISTSANLGVPDTDETPARKPFTSPPLDKKYQQRIRENQDLVVLISDWNDDRGTGKTTLSLKLAEHFDRTEEGITPEKCSLDASDLLNSYTKQPEGSALVLDEAEAQASKYRAGSAVNKALRELVSMGRVEEKYLIMNMPASSELDKDLLKLVHVWIIVTRKGRAIVHLLKGEPYSGSLLNPQSEILEWTDIPTGTPLRDVYNQLKRQKKRRLRGEEGDSLITEQEAQDRIQKAEKNARRETRDEIIRKLLNNADLTAPDIEIAFDVKANRIRQIARGE